MARVHNFSAGPATMPVEVLQQLSDELVEYASSGQSVVEMSHRSPEYESIHFETINLIRELWAIPNEFEIMLVQGGATLQFAMVPMNLSVAGQRIGYINGGVWGSKAFEDGQRLADAYQAWGPSGSGLARMPTASEVDVKPDTTYLHVTSNETIGGVRMVDFEGFGPRLVGDMSSDMLGRPINWDLFDLVYGGAQKNLGPSGLTLVVARSDILDRADQNVPNYLRYSFHSKANSLANTPPTFSVWAVNKVLKWIESKGGVPAMEQRATERSTMVYDMIDSSDGFYVNPVEPKYRSHMNIVLQPSNLDLTNDLLGEAADSGLINLKGHRSVGGIRVSIYNGMSTEGVEAVVDFLSNFAQKRG